jgi:CHASE3 domain sensor protein
MRLPIAMSLRRRLFFDLLAGLVVAILAMGVIYWQAATQPPDSSAGHTFRLLCPLH